MNKSAHVYRWLLLTALVFLEVVACKPTSPVFLDPGPLVPATVVKVAYGDTIKVRLDGADYLITYLEIDAPETQGNAKPGNTLGDGSFAAKASQQRASGRPDRLLKKDVSETDGRGGLLRYVWLDDGKMVNSLLVAEGYARAAILPPDTLYGDQILKLELEARRKRLGLWALVPEEASKTEPGS